MVCSVRYIIILVLCSISFDTPLPSMPYTAVFSFRLYKQCARQPNQITCSPVAILDALGDTLDIAGLFEADKRTPAGIGHARSCKVDGDWITK